MHNPTNEACFYVLKTKKNYPLPCHRYFYKSLFSSGFFQIRLAFDSDSTPKSNGKKHLLDFSAF